MRRAGWREIKILKPIDKVSSRRRRMVNRWLTYTTMDHTTLPITGDNGLSMRSVPNQSGGRSPGDVSHSVRWEPVSA
jgi:hypothetical protein